MLNLLWLIPALPFAGFLLLVLLGGRLSRSAVALVGSGSVGLSMLTTLAVGYTFIKSPPQGNFFLQTLWQWLEVGNFRPEIALYLDPLSLIMVFVVTFVGFLIHIYSTEFMENEEGYSRFFAYMNLFVGSMLVLLLASDLLLLYLGWEGVGLCSYLLIGFWYKDPDNGAAARKAFVVTRVGDTAFSIGLFLLFTSLGTLQIQEVMRQAETQWAAGSGIAAAVSLLLLGGAVGKSAQLPLQTWLPDAMAGPTPVSALIHAATMVTAGVYLIARTNALFTLAPEVLFVVGVIGAGTLLLSAFSALVQHDLKRILAYSTISQIGYMFLALGVGAWSAAIFHFMTHAFFKALLFLGAGVVIKAVRDEHDIFMMGGLRKQLPITFWTFLIGAASLAALPVLTAGFYSKDLILYEEWVSAGSSRWLWAAGFIGAFLTSLYTFRMVFVIFFGEPTTIVSSKPRIRMQAPLFVLAFLSVFGGFVEIPNNLGNFHAFTSFLERTLPPAVHMTGESITTETVLQIETAGVSLVAVYLAYLFFLKRPQYSRFLARSSYGKLLRNFWLGGWGFDRLYDKLLVRPFVTLAQSNKNDFIDLFPAGIIWVSRKFNRAFSLTQSGKVRWYAIAIALGAILTLAMVVLL